MKKQGFFGIIVFLPVVVATCAFLFLVVSSSCVMALWQVRKYASNVIAICMLLHFVIMLGFFLRCNWKGGLVALICLPVLLWAAFLGAMIAGPDIDSIKRDVAKAVSRPIDELECLGGNLSRESIVIWKCKRKLDVTFCNVRSIEKGEPPYVMAQRCVEEFGFHLHRPYKAWKIELNFDTILIVDDGASQLVIFVGMAIV